MLIGITGKSCSGKNHVCRVLASKGFEVWDLDREAEAIRKQESSLIMMTFGTTDKEELSSIIFNDYQKRVQLENIIYPKLIEKIKAYKFDLVINGATLYRSNLDCLCDFIIYIDAPYDVRCKRAQKRDGISEERFMQRENSQTDIDFRAVSYRCPVYVVDNTNAGNSAIERDLDKILSHRQ